MIHSNSEDERGISLAMRDTDSFAPLYPHSGTTNGKSLQQNIQNISCSFFFCYMSSFHFLPFFSFSVERKKDESPAPHDTVGTKAGNNLGKKGS